MPDLSPERTLAEIRWAVDLTVFALTVWREARGEGSAGMRAVACSIRNRIGKPYFRNRGASYYEACTAPWQYSAMTARADPQLGAWPRESDQAWRQALWICSEVMDGKMPDMFPGADSYHDESCTEEAAIRAGHTPDRLVGQVGRLKFYDTDRA